MRTEMVPAGPATATPGASRLAPPARARVFILGCPRSGTTWLQLMIAQHPKVATAHETHVFSRYFGHILSKWEEDRLKVDAPSRPGLFALLTRQEVLDLCRSFSDRVYERIAAPRPEASVLLVKAPDVEGETKLILETHPDARFVHIVRDPRAVAASLVSAGRGFGHFWAPKTAHDAVKRWVTTIRRVEEAKARGIPLYEIRYEDLHADPERRLGEVLAWIGLEADAALCKEIVAATAFEKLKARRADLRVPWDVNRHAEGFFRKGRPDSWREDLSPVELKAVEHAAFDFMKTFGYEPVSQTRPRQPGSVWLFRKRRRLARAITRWAAWISRRVEGPSP